MALKTIWLILIPYLIVLIGAILYIGGTACDNFFKSSSDFYCYTEDRHLGLFVQCIREISPIAGTAPDFKTVTHCYRYAVTNYALSASQGTWGFWISLFIIFTFLIILALCLWYSRGVRMARICTLAAAVVGALCFIFIIVSFAVFAGYARAGKILNIRYCSYAAGFGVALAGLIISLIGLMFAVPILILIGMGSSLLGRNISSPASPGAPKNTLYGPFYAAPRRSPPAAYRPYNRPYGPRPSPPYYGYRMRT